MEETVLHRTELLGLNVAVKESMDALEIRGAAWGARSGSRHPACERIK